MGALHGGSETCRVRQICCASALVLSVEASSAVAAEPAPPDSERLIEVRITAPRRREERLLDVPDSLTSLSATTLERSRVRTLKDVAPLVPNFSIVDAQQPGVALVNVRGIGQSRNTESPVAVVIDGVQASSSYQVTQELFDIERVEVLKGPQGAVYGRNALAGAINITTRAPTNEWRGSLRGGVGEDSEYYASGTLSGAIVPNELLFRVAGHGRHFGGNVSSPNTPGRPSANEMDDRGARLVLLANPGERSRLDFRVSHSFTESGAPWYARMPPGVSPDTPLPYEGDFPSHGDRALTDASLRADRDFGSAHLTSVTAYSKVATRLETEGDFSALDGLSGAQQLDARNWSQELRLASQDGSALDWLAGVYFLNTHQHFDTQVYLRSDLLGQFGLPPSLSPLLSASASSVDSNNAYAGFGQLSYRWPLGIELTMALRYDRDKRRQVDRTPGVSPRTYEATFDAWQPKVSLSWSATPTSMFYVTAGKGFRSGGFNPQERITRVYRAETNVSGEAGAKLSMLDNRVNLTAAVFHTRIRDRQVYTLDVLTSAQTLSNPIPRARVRGVELDVTARPVPPLEISASVGATRSRIERYDPAVFEGLPVAGDFTGNSLPQTPEFSWALQSQYRVALPHGLSITPRIEWTGQAGDYFWEIDNRIRRADLSLLNVRLIAERGPWTVTAFVENATDESYVLEYLPAAWSGIPAGDIAAAARGRHSGVEAAWRF